MVDVLDAIGAQPWLISEAGMQQILAVAQRQGENLDALAARLGRPLDNSQAVQVRGDAAVIPVRGPIFRYANMFTQVSGATSLEILAGDFQAALDDPSVARIVLEIDSPGGQSAGIAEFAGQIRAATKPVIAYIADQGASAAYWLASAGGSVVASPTALIGSVGVVATYRPDKSGAVRIVSSQSPMKQADPQTDAGLAEWQRVVDDLAAVFVADVARNRGVPESKVLSDFGRGGVLVGANAVAVGMADRIGTLESIIAEALAETNADNELRAEIERARQRIELHASAPKKTPQATEQTPMTVDEFENEIMAARPDAHDVERRVREAWKNNPAMRAEFGEVENAAAYFRARAAGLARRNGDARRG